GRSGALADAGSIARWWSDASHDRYSFAWQSRQRSEPTYEADRPGSVARHPSAVARLPSVSARSSARDAGTTFSIPTSRRNGKTVDTGRGGTVTVMDDAIPPHGARCLYCLPRRVACGVCGSGEASVQVGTPLVEELRGH